MGHETYGSGSQEVGTAMQESAREQWTGNGPAEEVLNSSLPRIYFSTDHHLYALVYQRTQTGYLDTPFIKTPLFRLDFLAPLLEVPFTGESWQRVIEDLMEEDERTTLLHLPSYGSHLGHFTVTRPNARPIDINCIALLRPSHTTQEIAQLLARDGELWHIKAADAHEHGGGPPPPEPNPHREYDQDQTMLYDLFARGRFLAGLYTQVRLSLDEALQQGLALTGREHGIFLRYAEPEDTLEWVNPQPTLEPKSPDQPVLSQNTIAQ